jgi:hypothetical protein
MALLEATALDIGMRVVFNSIQKQQFTVWSLTDALRNMRLWGTKRHALPKYFPAFVALLVILCLGLVIHVPLWTNRIWVSVEIEQHMNVSTNVRGVARKLGGYAGYEVNEDQLMGAEVGFIAGLAVMLVVLLCLCSCCCRARRISICEVLACCWLWEVCCDDGRAGDIRLI